MESEDETEVVREFGGVTRLLGPWVVAVLHLPHGSLALQDKQQLFFARPDARGVSAQIAVAQPGHPQRSAGFVCLPLHQGAKALMAGDASSAPKPKLGAWLPLRDSL